MTDKCLSSGIEFIQFNSILFPPQFYFLFPLALLTTMYQDITNKRELSLGRVYFGTYSGHSEMRIR